MRWHAALLVTLMGCVPSAQQKTQPVSSPSPIVYSIKRESVTRAQPSFEPAKLHNYPINTNQPAPTNYFVPLQWDTNALAGKTAFDVQESHDLKAWKTILTNVTGQPWVTNTGSQTYWRVVAR